MKAKLSLELYKAQQGGYALPAFNFDNFEMMSAIIAAAENTKAPIILMITESAALYMGVENVLLMATTAVNKAQVPIVLHWDHGYDINLVKKAIDAGFSSVMLDASLQPFVANVKATQTIVKYAHSKGVEVEAEIGHVGGKEDDRNSDNKSYTNVDEAIKFVKQTKIDALAIAIGTSHGLYRGKVVLQFSLLSAIRAAINIPLVLHGASQVPLVDLQQAISFGITKINIGTDLKISYANALKQWFIANPTSFDPRKFGHAGQEAVKAMAITKIMAFGANNKVIK